VSLGLYTDSNDQPGSLLESWSITVPGFPGTLTTIPSVLNPVLSAGTQYWFVVTVTDAQKNKLAWYENDQNVSGGVWAGNSLDQMLNFVSGSPMPAIELNTVETSAVPEPAGGTLLVMGLAGLAMLTIVSRSRSKSPRAPDSCGVLKKLP